MSGYTATSTTLLSVATGAQAFTTQSALSYVAAERVTLTYTANTTIFMSGTILSYNAINGAMVVNFDTVSGVYGLQPPWNTQLWDATSGMFASWTLSLTGAIPVPSTTVIPTIIVRTLNQSTWDPQRGQGLNNFLTDAAAVAQILATRIKFLKGESFENTADGTPLFQSILTKSTTMPAVALILRQRILGTPFVTAISSFTINYVPGGRAFSFSATVQTAFGAVAIANSQT